MPRPLGREIDHPRYYPAGEIPSDEGEVSWDRMMASPSVGECDKRQDASWDKSAKDAWEVFVGCEVFPNSSNRI